MSEAATGWSAAAAVSATSKRRICVDFISGCDYRGLTAQLVAPCSSYRMALDGVIGFTGDMLRIVFSLVWYVLGGNTSFMEFSCTHRVLRGVC